MLLLATVSYWVAVPVVKLVELTVAVQVLLRFPRVSLTETAPRFLERVRDPTATLPRFAEAGSLMVNDPAVNWNVVVVPAAEAPGAATDKPAAATASAGMNRIKRLLVLPRIVRYPP